LAPPPGGGGRVLLHCRGREREALEYTRDSTVRVIDEINHTISCSLARFLII